MAGNTVFLLFAMLCIRYSAGYTYWKPLNCNNNVICSNKEGNFQCDAWKSLGYCTNKWKTYMQENCLKSCGLCGYGYGCGKSASVNSSTNALNGNEYYSSQEERNTYSRPHSKSIAEYNNYPKYGITKKSDTTKNDARSLFSKRFGSYVTSHGYAEAQAKEFIHTAALTGNGLAFFAVIVGAIALALQQTRINDLQYQINRVSSGSNGNFAYDSNSSSAYESRIGSLESMVATLNAASNTAVSNINALSADQSSICSQLRSALSISSAPTIAQWVQSWNAISNPVCS